MLLTCIPWCQVRGTKPFLRRPARRKTLRWVPVLEPMEIRTVLSPSNLTTQMLELAVPNSPEAASTDLRAADATKTHDSENDSHRSDQAAEDQETEISNEFGRELAETSRGVPQVSIDSRAVVISLTETGTGNDFESRATFSQGLTAIHRLFAIMNFEQLSWTISLTTEGGRIIDHSIKVWNMTASLFTGRWGFDVVVEPTHSFGLDARPNIRVANTAPDLVTQSRFTTTSRSSGTEVPSDSYRDIGRADVFARSIALPRVVSETSPSSAFGILTAFSPSALLTSYQANLRVDGDDSRLDRDEVVLDRVMLERLSENVKVRRSERLIDGPIGDRDDHIVRLLESPTIQSSVPPLAPLTLPIWDSEFLVPAKPTNPGQPAKPDQPNQSDQNQPNQNSRDKKKTPKGKVQDKKKQDDSNQDKLNPTDGQKDTGTKEEDSSTAPTMSAAPQPRIKPIWAFLDVRQSRGDDTTASEAGPTHDAPGRSWWDACRDTTAWLAGIVSLSSIAAVWQDNRKRDDTDATPRR